MQVFQEQLLSAEVLSQKQAVHKSIYQKILEYHESRRSQFYPSLGDKPRHVFPTDTASNVKCSILPNAAQNNTFL